MLTYEEALSYEGKTLLKEKALGMAQGDNNLLKGADHAETESLL